MDNEVRQRMNDADAITEAPVGPDLAAAATIPQGTDATPSFLSSLLSALPPRWQNWVIRGITTLGMIGSFALVIYLGPLALVVLCLIIQMTCFHEIITIGYVVYKSHDLPLFRTLSWFFLFSSNYFIFGENWIDNFRILLSKEQFLQPLITYHRFISFSLYCGGVVAFVMSLKKKHYLQQFTLFGWTHVTLLIIVTSSHLIMKNIFNGMIWFLVPVSMIICNDIMAYMFGFFFGRTPLIKLSPKKTWEGFIGGGLSTVVFGILLSYVLVPYDYFVCPIEYDDKKAALSMECIRNPVFQKVVYEIPKWMTFYPYNSIVWYPFIRHAVILSLFASIIGPFGGFFASGFKRAFKIKDFGTILPGHGGMVDRFDCQVLMTMFVFVYVHSFISIPSANYVLQQIFRLHPNEQLSLHKELTEGLQRRGIL